MYPSYRQLSGNGGVFQLCSHLSINSRMCWIWTFVHFQALPIFIDALLPAWGAILISVTLILAFGEVKRYCSVWCWPRIWTVLSIIKWCVCASFQIIPQAVCSRYGLSVGAKLSILVRFIVIILFPLAYPISKVIACLLTGLSNWPPFLMVSYISFKPAAWFASWEKAFCTSASSRTKDSGRYACKRGNHLDQMHGVLWTEIKARDKLFIFWPVFRQEMVVSWRMMKPQSLLELWIWHRRLPRMLWHPYRKFSRFTWMLS